MFFIIERNKTNLKKHRCIRVYIITEEKRSDAANEKLAILEKEAVCSYFNSSIRLRRQDAENMEAAETGIFFFLFFICNHFCFLNKLKNNN